MMESNLFKWGVLAPAAALLWGKVLMNILYFTLVLFIPVGAGI